MIDIRDIQGSVIYSTEINVGSKRKFTLMKEDYITLRFSLEKPINFPLGTKVDDASIGLFEVVDLQKPTRNNSTGGYDYELRLDSYYWKWKNKIFKFTPETGGQEASWSLTASLDVHLSIFLKNLKALGYQYRGIEFNFSIDASVENKAVSMSYQNMNMIDALTALAEAYECEWWVTDNIIHFGRCEYGTPVDFEIDNNVVEMKRSESQSNFATRLYVFGSTRNIPANYRPVSESVVVNGVVQKRLMLPEGLPYLDAYEDMPQEEAIEEVVILEDVYPKMENSISSVETYSDTVENEDGTTNTETFYRFRDKSFTFSEEYILKGEELRIKFQSGFLNGMDFGVKFNPNAVSEKLENGSWNPEAQLFEIVVNEDYGRKLPDDTLNPKVGDKYILYGWDSTKLADLGLVSKAEKELEEKGREILAKRKIDPNTYNCKMFSDYMYGLDSDGNQDSVYSKHFEVGDKVNLINSAYFENGRQSRIIGYEYNLDFPYDSPIYTVGETAAYSRLGEIESKLESLTLAGQTYVGGGGSSVYIIGTNDTTKPTNRNVYSALRSDQSYLRKDKDDKTPHNLSVGKNLNVDKNVTIGGGISSKSFASGFTGGKGWAIRMKEYLNSAGVLENRSEAEVDDLIVRGTMRVYEFIVSQLLGENDNRIFTAMLEVDHYDKETGMVWLDTQGGKLYNPFRVDDIILVQQYNGMPSEENDYYITKQYELVVSEIGVGDLSLGEDRLDWVKFRNFSSQTEGATEELITKGDTFVRIDNLSNPDRKGIIEMMTVGADTPYMDVVYGKKTDPDNALKARFGNLQGIYSPLFGWLKDFGAYITNLYAVGEFRIAHTGEDVADAIEMTKGAFRTNFKQVMYDMTEEDNLLSNGVFAGDLSMWQLGESETNFLTVDGTPVVANRNMLSAEESFCGIDEYMGRNLMRIYDSKVTQPNSYIERPDTHKEYEEGEDGEMIEKEVPDKVYLTLNYYCRKDGDLWVGFTDGNGNPHNSTFPNTSVHIESGIERKSVTCEGEWDGAGNFTISTTGDIYVDMVVLTTKPLEDFKAEYSTRIEQDARRIALIAEKTTETESKVAQLEITANGLSSTVATAQGSAEEAKRLAYAAEEAANDAYSRANSAYGLADSAYDNAATAIQQSAQAISMIAANFNDDGSLKNTSGLVIASDFTNLSTRVGDVEASISTFVTQDELGEAISNIQLTADNINFNNGVMVINKTTAQIGKFSIDANGLYTTSTNAYIKFDFSGTKFIRINNSADPALFYGRNDDGTIINLNSYGSGVCVDLLCNHASGYALKTQGRVLLESLDTNRSIRIHGGCTFTNSFDIRYSASSTYKATFSLDYSNRLMMYSNYWAKEESVSNGYMYVDGSGYMKVKGATRV